MIQYLFDKYFQSEIFRIMKFPIISNEGPKWAFLSVCGALFAFSSALTNDATTDGRRGQWHLLKAGVIFTSPPTHPMSLHSFANTTSTSVLTWLSKPYFQGDRGARRGVGVPQELLHLRLLLLSFASFCAFLFALSGSSLSPRCCFRLRLFFGCHLLGCSRWF